MKDSEYRKQELDSMDEHTNDMKYFSALMKYKRALKAEHFVEQVIPELSMFTIKEFAQNSFRITDGELIVDIYPKSGKWFDHKKQNWFSKKITVDSIKYYFIQE